MTGQQLFVKIDADLKREFKSKLAERDLTQQKVLEAAIRHFMKENGEPEWLQND